MDFVARQGARRSHSGTMATTRPLQAIHGLRGTWAPARRNAGSRRKTPELFDGTCGTGHYSMRIWKSELTLDQANGWHNTMIERIGIAVTEIGDDYVRGTMPVDARTHQPYGLLHGGASVALAETLGSLGAMMCADAKTHLAV